MTWKDILKMPLDPKRMYERDDDYKQKIINFEKEEMTPALESILAGQNAGTGVTIEFTMDSSAPTGAKKTGSSKMMYNMGKTTVNELGGNYRLISGTIAELYRNLGYDVNEFMKPNPNTGGNDSVMRISYPDIS